MNETAKQVLHFNVLKGFSSGQSDEHQRNWSEAAWKHAISKGNYDRSRERLNFEITKGGVIRPIDKRKSMPERMAENLKQRGIKDPNAGLAQPRFRTVVDFILSGSQEPMRKLAFGSQEVVYGAGDHEENYSLKRMPEFENWAKDMYTFICDKYGEENIIGFYAHLDETSAHLHCTIMPIKDGKFAFKEMFAGKDKFEFSARTKALHDELAEINRHWNLVRGTSLSGTPKRRRTSEEYFRHLDAWCLSLEEEVKQHQKVLRDLQTEQAMAERRVKGLTSMVTNLEAEKAEKEKTIAELHRQLRNQEGDSAELSARLRDLQHELSDLDLKLADKKEKLSEADQKLRDLNEDQSYIQQRTDDLKEESAKYSEEIRQNVGSFVKDAMLENLINDFQTRRESLSDEELKFLSGSPLIEFAEHGSEILHCATLLFLGYLDNATTFAEGHGGGGSGSDLKWDRDDDEDSRQWARRCLRMASKMMRPAGGKSRKR